MNDLKIKNSNFIAPYMNLHDIEGAFDIPNIKTTKKFTYDKLISEGWLKKANERSYKPTEKLLNLVFLPEKLVLDGEQIRLLSYNIRFTRNDLINLFKDNSQIVKALIRKGYIILDKFGVYRKSVSFEEALAEGENNFFLKNT